MVRFKNNSYFEWIVSFTFAFFLLSFTSLYAQPTGCDTPPIGDKGGDFDFTANQTLINSAVCLPKGVDSLSVTFTQKADPSLSGLLASNTLGYNFNVTNSTNFATDFNSTTSSFFKAGTYYIAQIGILGGKNYQQCKKLTVYKIQPVEAKIVTCGSSLIKVTIPSKATVPTNDHQQYSVNWGDGSPIEVKTATGSPIVFTKVFTPSSPVFVTGNYLDDAGNVVCSSDPTFSIPDPSNAVYIDKVAKAANKTDYEIGFKGFVSNVNYKLSYAEAGNSTTYTQATGDFSNGNALVKGLNPIKDYCFKIVYVDNCDVPSESNIVCSMTLTGDILSDSDIDLNWTIPGQPNPVFLETNVLKKDNVNCPTASCRNDLLLPSINARKITYNQLECDRIFTFQAVNTFRASIKGIIRTIEVSSNTVTVDPANGPKPPAPTFPMAVGYVNGEENEIYVNIYQLFPRKKYNFYRAVGGSEDYKLIRTLNTNEIRDTDLQPDQGVYCYKYSYEDACGRVSELSDAYCTIFLNSRSPNSIDWTEYTVPNTENMTPTTYYVELIDPVTGMATPITATDLLSNDVQQLIANTGNAEIKFRILAVQQAQVSEGVKFNFSSYSNTFTFILPPTLFVPSAFTPNGDGINEIFKVESRFVKSMTLRVYDRWGSIIFESQELENGWNGTIGGGIGSQKAPPGTYAYKLEAVNERGEMIVKTGSVTLIR